MKKRNGTSKVVILKPVTPLGNLAKIEDPEILIRRASLYFASNPDRGKKLDEAIETNLQRQTNKTRESVMRAALEKDFEGQVGQ